MLPTINLFGFHFSTYWMMFFIGVIGICVLCCLRAKKYQMSYHVAILFSILLTVTGLAGTKFLYILENLQDTLTNGVTLGGQSFFGAVFLIPLVMPLLGRLFRLTASETLDLCASPVIFILMCMRMGCMLNGCCGGIVIAGVQIPTQLMEALFDAFLFAYLWKQEKAGAKKSLLYPYFMMLYSCFRFLIEFVRSTPKDWLFLSHGQWFSLIAALIGFAIIYHAKRNEVIKDD